MKHIVFFVLVFSSIQLHAQTTTADIQKRIDAGETPKQIIRSGVPMDSLYGVYYQGGHIFYFFPEDTSGMVVGPKNLTYTYDTSKVRIVWSCRGKNTGATDRAIGAGKKNTEKIINAGCTLYDADEKRWMKSAAELCVHYKGGGYNDWFLPSKDELHEIYMNLGYTGKVDFGNKEFWSSTEVNEDFAAVEHLKYGWREFELFGQSNFMKFHWYFVRPVRIFH